MRHRIEPTLLFAFHQLVGTWGIPVLAYYSGAWIFDVFGWFGWHPSMRFLFWILTETPVFPVQIVLGAYFGWRLSLRFRHGVMIWIWVLPALILSYSILVRNPPSVFSKADVLQHYFGWGCQPKDHCLDQPVFTMPFYVSIAYSLAGWLTLRLAAPLR